MDGSGWQSVYKTLSKQGYQVSIVQNPTLSLEEDVAFTKRVIASQAGPVILVGHSYGGAVITQAGNDPKVIGLVYITAFAPDKGESVATLLANPAAGCARSPDSSSARRLAHDGQGEVRRIVRSRRSKGRR